MKFGLILDVTYLIVFGLRKMELVILFSLFDLKLNTIVSRELADSESVKSVYKFLEKSLRNQKNCIITDLKNDYIIAIDKLQIKQQFCTFHLKQLINRKIYNYNQQINSTKGK